MPDEEKCRAASERVDENDFRQELKLADKLAIERTVLAADRTMLAAVRTSIAFIGFGFTIFNVLKYVQEHSPVRVIMRPHTPRNCCERTASGPITDCRDRLSKTLLL
jgi:uncharacterized membrane protein YidH (DUF202 family)